MAKSGDSSKFWKSLASKLSSRSDSDVFQPQGRYTPLDEGETSDDDIQTKPSTARNPVETGKPQTYETVRKLNPDARLQEADVNGNSVWGWKRRYPAKWSEIFGSDKFIEDSEVVPLGTLYTDRYCQENNNNRYGEIPIYVKKTIRNSKDGQVRTFCYYTHKSEWTEKDLIRCPGCVNHSKGDTFDWNVGTTAVDETA